MKKSLVKAVTVGITAMMAGSMLAACGSSSSSSSTASASAASSTSASSEAEVWNIGTNAEFPPFEEPASSSAEDSVDGYRGIDMEIISKIAEENNAEVKINNMEFDSLTVALKNGQVDAVIAGMTVTEERAEEVDFSDTYYVAKQVMIVKEDNTDITKASDMEGKTIAVIQGYTGQTAVDELGYDYEAFKKGTEAILELENGKCDVVVIDAATANQYIKENEGLKIVEDDDAFSSEEYAIAVAKGNTELLDKINASIKEMKEDGTIDEISAKYAEASEE